MERGAHGSAALDASAVREAAGFDVASVALALLTAAGLILTASLGVEALYEHAARVERARKDAVIAPASTVAPLARQAELLRGYRWVDRKTGVIAIPIERAMERVAAEGSTSTGEERP